MNMIIRRVQVVQPIRRFDQNKFQLRRYADKKKEAAKKDAPKKAAPKKDAPKKDAPKKEAPKPPKKMDPNKIVSVYRFAGTETREKESMQTYNLDVSKIGPMVLDVLMKLKDMDPTLTFRRSCREGICGSCAVNVQGANCLACITATPAAKKIAIYPIPHMYVIRDLVVDMQHFYDGYDSIRPYLIRSGGIPSFGEEQFAQSIKDNVKLTGLYECVLCACCSTSCPAYWWNGRRFLGPAALMHAYRWIIDSRDGDATRRLADLRDDFKAFRCHSIFQCLLACPKGLKPGVYIQYLKRLISGLDKKPLPEMEPDKFLQGKGGKGKKSVCCK